MPSYVTQSEVEAAGAPGARDGRTPGRAASTLGRVLVLQSARPLPVVRRIGPHFRTASCGRLPSPPAAASGAPRAEAIDGVLPWAWPADGAPGPGDGVG